MAITFPENLDTFTNPVSTDTLASPSHADQHANINDAVESLETKVGIDGSAEVTSIDYKLTSTSSSNPGHKHTLTDGATDITASKDEINQLNGNTFGGTTSGDVVTIDGTQTLINKTLTIPTVKNKIRSSGGESLTNLADDTATTITVPTGEGFIIIVGMGGRGTSGCIANYRTNPSSCNITMQGIAGDWEAKTGILTGTTGTDGKMVVSVHTDNKLYVENRKGITVYFQYFLIGTGNLI